MKSEESPPTDNASAVGGKEELTNIPPVKRVNDLDGLHEILSILTHNEMVHAYCMKKWRDPDTLMLVRGRGCIIASIIEHDFFGRICCIVWAQNPDHFPVVGKTLDMVDEWATDHKCDAVVAFVAPDGPWDKLKAWMRMSRLKPFRMVFSKALD